MRVLDLFCGMGGASVGYAMAGLDIVAGIDMSRPSYPATRSTAT
jgi:site-specific DNA-cytosine methylase